MSQKSITEIDNEIAKLQQAIDRLTTEKNNQLTLLNDAKAQRPQGVPGSWLPTYDEKNGRAIVTAWFDPAKYGSNLILFTQ